MAFDAAVAEGPSPRRGRPKIILLALAAVGASLAVAAWITDSNLSTLASAALPGATTSGNADQASFEDRFFLARKGDPLVPLKHSVLAAAETETGSLPAQEPLALQSVPQDLRGISADDETPAVSAKPPAVAGIPLPRSRPVAADLTASPVLARAEATSQPADRTLLQKLSDLMPGRLTLASLTPDGALFGRGPDLAALGYDGSTAVYDISAHAVYMPNRTVFEAHSGMGNLRDDPEHVSVPNQGATPPAVYSLKPRESEFHGVQALRMTPAEGSDISGRSGLLVHSYMLGPKGDSNGCVSIKDYDRFLKAFNDGQVNRMVVVPSLKAAETLAAAQNPT